MVNVLVLPTTTNSNVIVTGAGNVGTGGVRGGWGAMGGGGGGWVMVT